MYVLTVTVMESWYWKYPYLVLSIKWGIEKTADLQKQEGFKSHVSKYNHLTYYFWEELYKLTTEKKIFHYISFLNLLTPWWMWLKEFMT